METIRKCSVCGKEKSISEFSKSYPNRCKECVAEHTRKVRKEAKEGKMRTGSLRVGLGLNKEDVKRFVKDSIDEIMWEQRRYEIAKELMKGFATNSHNMLVDAKIGTLAEWSVSGADALITELKKGGEK